MTISPPSAALRQALVEVIARERQEWRAAREQIEGQARADVADLAARYARADEAREVRIRQIDELLNLIAEQDARLRALEARLAAEPVAPPLEGQPHAD